MRGIGQATISPGYGEPGILLDGLSNIRKGGNPTERPRR
jgi:hypothetical protein